MKTFKKVLVCFFLTIASVTAFTGCQTAKGFGEDMENAGEDIQEGVSK